MSRTVAEVHGLPSPWAPRAPGDQRRWRAATCRRGPVSPPADLGCLRLHDPAHVEHRPPGLLIVSGSPVTRSSRGIPYPYGRTARRRTCPPGRSPAACWPPAAGVPARLVRHAHHHSRHRHVRVVGQPQRPGNRLHRNPRTTGLHHVNQSSRSRGSRQARSRSSAISPSASPLRSMSRARRTQDGSCEVPYRASPSRQRRAQAETPRLEARPAHLPPW